MLTQLLPDQISNFWDIIKYAIEQSLPPIAGDHPDRMNRILSSMLSGKTQCWASYTRGEEETKFEGIALTQVLYDDASNTRNLLIYCIYGYNPVDSGSWLKALTSLVKYSKSQGCTQIVSYTDVPHLIKLAKKLGGETKYTFISFDVNKTVQLLNQLSGE